MIFVATCLSLIRVEVPDTIYFRRKRKLYFSIVGLFWTVSM